MKRYIYTGIYDCYYQDSCIAIMGDTLIIDNNQIRNITKNSKFIKVPEEFIKNILKDCREYPENVEDVFPEPFIALPTINTAAEEFESITKGMADTFKRKNHDYGNSFEESLNEEGIAAARIRMGDKWNRFKTLSKNPNDIRVIDESLIDTLLDLSVYSIMTVMWLRHNKLSQNG